MKYQKAVVLTVSTILFVLGLFWIMNKYAQPSTTPSNNPTDFDQLTIITLKEASNESAPVKEGDTVTVHYTGYLPDGSVFDSSYDRSTPFTFTVGEGNVIEGWEKGLIGMKVGEVRKLEIPSDMAYGDRGVPPLIPPKTGLIFEVELLEIN